MASVCEKAPLHWHIRNICYYCRAKFATSFEYKHHSRHDCVRTPYSAGACKDVPCVCPTWDPAIDRSKPQIIECPDCKATFSTWSELGYHESHTCFTTPYDNGSCHVYMETGACSCNPTEMSYVFETSEEKQQNVE
jgi:hypothetical protein